MTLRLHVAVHLFSRQVHKDHRPDEIKMLKEQMSGTHHTQGDGRVCLSIKFITRFYSAYLHSFPSLMVSS